MWVYVSSVLAFSAFIQRHSYVPGLIVPDSRKDFRGTRALLDLLASVGDASALKARKLGPWSNTWRLMHIAVHRERLTEPPVNTAGFQTTVVEFVHMNGHDDLFRAQDLWATLHVLLRRGQRQCCGTNAHVVSEHHGLALNPAPRSSCVKAFNLILRKAVYRWPASPMLLLHLVLPYMIKITIGRRYICGRVIKQINSRT